MPEIERLWINGKSNGDEIIYIESKLTNLENNLPSMI